MTGHETEDVGAGRAPAPGAIRYGMTGGALCLDLVNTVESRPTDRPVELLRTVEDLLSWARQAGLVDGRQAARLGRDADLRPRRGSALLKRARTLREALFSLFAAEAGGETPPRADLEVLNSMMPAAMAALRITHGTSGYRWSWAPRSEGLDGLLHPVIDSACELLASDDLGRLRCCESERCDWLFIDCSRNRSRRWCDMSSCGNRAKARRHYARQKGASGRNKARPRPVSS